MAEASPYLDALRLDISVSTEDDLVVDNNYGRFQAGADVRLQGTVGRPGVTGRAELREGGDKRAHVTIARLRREMLCEGGAQ